MANSAVTPAQVSAVALVYSVARSVVDELKPAEGEVSDSYDEAVFNSAMKVLKDKEGENHG